MIFLAQNRDLRTKAFAGLLLFLSATRCFAFAEDICAPDSGGWAGCELRPCAPGDEKQTCETITLVSTIIAGINRHNGARSTVHFDSTYYLAQAVGFTPRDAYLIAAYDEDVDVGKFVLLDQTAQPVVDESLCDGSASAPQGCELVTLNIGGVNRNNFVSGGVFFHFMAAAGATIATDGLAPIVTNPAIEPFLDHVRRWAYGLGPLCVDGLTVETASGNYAEGASCFQSTTRPTSTLVGKLPILSETGFLTSIDWITPLGEQTVVTDPVSGVDMPASMIDNYLSPQDTQVAKLGIYLHTLTDRISHHVCLDASPTVGARPANALPVALNAVAYPLYIGLIGSNAETTTPSGSKTLVTLANPDFVVKFDTKECDQFDHSQRHSFETGTDQSLLAAADQTTAAALTNELSELETYFQTFYPSSAASTRLPPAAEQGFVSAIVRALEVQKAQLRLNALTAIAKSKGWLPLPGYGGVSLAEWELQADTAHCGPAGCAKSEALLPRK